MRKFIAIAAVLIVAGYLFYSFELGRSMDRVATVSTKNFLLVALAELNEHGAFTNHAPDRCHVYAFTNRYSVSGTNYCCVLAADSWDYRESSNVLAITTNELFLFIGKQGLIPSLGNSYPPRH